VVVSTVKNRFTQSLAARGALALTVMTTLVAVVEAGKKW
jgi:hypothetical protein